MRDIKELYELLENCQEDGQRIHILFDIATYMLNVSEKRVLETVEQMEQTAERLNSDLGRSYGHSTRGRMFYRKSMYTDAAREFQLALDKALLTDDLLTQAMCYDSLGVVCNPLNRHEQALEMALQALALYKQIPTQASRWQQIVCYNNIGNAYKEMRDWQPAEDAYRKGVVLADEEADDRMKSNLLANLCQVKIEQGLFDEGLQLVGPAIEGFKKYNHKIGEAHATVFLAHCRLGKGEYALAIQDYLAVLKKLKDIDYKLAEIYAYQGLGNAYCKMLAYAEAVSHYQKALDIAQAANSHKEVCNLYLCLGRVHASLGETLQSETYLEQGRKLALEKGFVHLMEKEDKPVVAN